MARECPVIWCRAEWLLQKLFWEYPFQFWNEFTFSVFRPCFVFTFCEYSKKQALLGWEIAEDWKLTWILKFSTKANFIVYKLKLVIVLACHYIHHPIPSLTSFNTVFKASAFRPTDDLYTEVIIQCDFCSELFMTKLQTKTYSLKKYEKIIINIFQNFAIFFRKLTNKDRGENSWISYRIRVIHSAVLQRLS